MVDSAMLLLPWALVVTATPNQETALAHLTQVLAPSIAGYVRQQERNYTRTDVFDYIDGGAELYLAFAFQGVLGCRYQREGYPDVLLDVFDMGTSADAFGVFSLERDGEEVGIGQASEYTPGMLRFWKDHFFIAVTATGLVEETTHVVLAIGRTCANAIVGEGTPPALLDLLPPEGLDFESVRYCHSELILRQYCNLDGLEQGKILALAADVEVVLATYRAQPSAQLLVIGYPSEASAMRVETAVLGRLREAEPGLALPVAMAREGSVLAIVLRAPDRKRAEQLCEAFVSRIQERP